MAVATFESRRLWRGMIIAIAVLALAALGVLVPVGPAVAAEPTDLEITQTAAPDPVAVGSELTWSIVVANLGPGAASGVEVNDNFNQYGIMTEFVSLATSQGSCTNSDNTFNCQLGDVPNGSSVTITLTVMVLESGAVHNVADVTTGSGDTNWDNNHIDDIVSSGPAADLEIAKSVTPTTASPGDSIEYALTVTNHGPTTAQGALVTDVLPAGLIGVQVEPAGSCELHGNEVECELGTLASQASVDVTITATIDPGLAGDELSNTATVAATTPDSDLTNNTATAVVEIAAPSADVSVVKTVEPANVVAGDTVRYRIEVGNEGPAIAEDVTLEDVLPDALRDPAVSTELGECTITTGTVSCDFGSLPSGVEFAVVVTATVAADASGSLTNTATAESSTADSDRSNNTSTVTNALESVADLAISKTASPSTGGNGDLITYTLRVTNSGPSDAPGTVVTDTLPDDLSYQAGSCSTPQGTCDIAGSELTYELGTVANGATVELTFQARIADDAPDEVLTNTATVSHEAEDPEPDNNIATHDLNVDAGADLVLSKTADPTTAIAGEQLTFTLRVHNDGPGSSTDLAIVDRVPDEVNISTVTPDAGSCDPVEENRVTCSLTELSAGDDWVVTITGTVDPSAPRGFLRNTATTTGENDPTNSNNIATVVVPISTRAELTIDKQGPATAQAGSEIDYSIDVSNAGPSSAANTVVIDRLPTGTTFVAGGTDDVSCSADPSKRRLVTCVIGTLSPGQPVTIPITVAVDPSVPGGTTLVNVADVASTTPGTSDGTSDQVETEVTADADLSVLKSVSPAAPVAGGPITYLIRVHNAGPSMATELELSDALPDGLEIETVAPTAGICADPVAGTLTCTRDSLAPGATWSVIITGAVADSVTGDLINRVEIASDTPDPESDNNVASVTVTIGQAADVAVAKRTLTPERSPGQIAVFLLSVTNRGPSTGREVELVDELPAGLVPQTVSSDACEIQGQTVSCSYDELPRNETRVVVVTATVGSDVPVGVLTNTASVSAETPDPESTNNAGSAMVTIEAQPTPTQTPTPTPTEPSPTPSSPAPTSTTSPGPKPSSSTTTSSPSKNDQESSLAETGGSLAGLVPGVLAIAAGASLLAYSRRRSGR